MEPPALRGSLKEWPGDCCGALRRAGRTLRRTETRQDALVSDIRGRTSEHMGKKGRDRGQRRRGFDDDSFGGPESRDETPYQPPSFRRPAARQDAAPPGPALDATVKWFNAEKGFGFVELGDGSGDAFLHIGVLQNAGHDVVAPETKLKVQVGQGQKGRQVTAVREVDAPSAAAQPARRPPVKQSFDRGLPDPSTA